MPKNILGHSGEIRLFDSSGNLMYTYEKLEGKIYETYFSEFGEILCFNEWS